MPQNLVVFYVKGVKGVKGAKAAKESILELRFRSDEGIQGQPIIV